MNKYSDLQDQAFLHVMEKTELEQAHKDRVTQLEGEIKRFKLLAEENEALVAKMQDSEPAVADMVGSSAAQSSWETERGALQARIEQVEVQLHSKEEAESQAMDELARLQVQLQDKEVAELQARDQLARLEVQLQSNEVELTQAREQALQHTATVEELKAECGRLRDFVSQKENDLVSFQEERQQLIQQRNHYEELCASLRSQTVSKDAMQAQADELAAAREQLARDQEVKVQLQQELSERTAELDALQAEIAVKATSIVELQSDLSQQHEKHAELELALATKVKQHEEADAAKAASIIELQSELSQHHEKHAALERALTTNVKQHEEAEQRIRELQQECDQLREDIESANELDLSSLYERQLKKAQADNAALKAKIQEMEERASQDKVASQTTQQLLEEKIASSQLEVQRLKEEISQLQESLVAATDEASKSIEIRASLEHANAMLVEAEARHASAVRNLEEENQHLQETVQRQQIEHNLLKQQLESLNTSETEEKESKLQFQLEEESAIKCALQVELAAANARLDELARQNNEFLLEKDELKASRIIFMLP